MPELEPMQERFVQEYLFDLNQTKAAIRAGYSPKSAKSVASRLMKNKAVKEAVEIAMAERSRRTGISQDRVITELAKIAFVNVGDFMDINHAKVKDNITPEDTAAISGVKYKSFDSDSGGGVERSIEMHNKIKALELLGKHLGMFNDKIHLETDNELSIKISGDFDDC